MTNQETLTYRGLQLISNIVTAHLLINKDENLNVDALTTKIKKDVANTFKLTVM